MSYAEVSAYYTVRDNILIYSELMVRSYSLFLYLLKMNISMLVSLSFIVISGFSKITHLDMSAVLLDTITKR